MCKELEKFGLPFLRSRAFADDLQAVQNSKLHKSSKINKFDPFVDDKGLL
jgi:hypothetical protein